MNEEEEEVVLGVRDCSAFEGVRADELPPFIRMILKAVHSKRGGANFVFRRSLTCSMLNN